MPYGGMTDTDRLTRLLLPDLMVVEDLALRLHRSPSAVRQLLRSGALPGRKVGSRWVIERGALLRALAPDRDCSPLRVIPGRQDAAPSEDRS